MDVRVHPTVAGADGTGTPTGTPVVDAPPSRLPSLTGLRWIAALLVFGFHAATMGIVAEPALKAVVDKTFALGLSGVEFFFVLSGFVLVWSARPGQRRRDLWRRRLAKIYPNHLVTWAAALLVGWWFADPLPLRATVENLLLVQAWDPTPGHFYSVNTVSWSLSCELFFYLALPFALPVVRRMRPAALAAVVVAVPLLIVALWPAQQLVPETDRWWFTQIFPVVRSMEFWLGVAAAELLRRGRWRGPGLAVASGIFVATWLVAALWVRAELWAGLMAATYVLVIAAAARADVQDRPTPWRGRRMRWLGEVSFAFYLVHVLVMVTVLRLTGHRGEGLPGWWGPVAVLGFLLVNLVLAGLLHRWVETPMMRRLAPPRRRPAVEPPTAPEPAVVPESAASAAAPPGAVARVPAQRSGDPDQPLTYAGRRDPV
ncbi:Peptidoglycan/LPS O-acetylase OafA/YrhL, contains acyltransferase and SGNH-hydrolase domains [Micromonospora siamensis]|uniref:Peptidoglycan/LPS O-acetylase OafA/YrhL, contains acyltransferase and SGNH-hydrolase domains n=2 Tax=Micromonospora siamensis TaxID=299152 RepID=A0A1C5HYU3_9ACTN|nr:Peptidoglycan/LPS O-acetylase OafA/YrhL, contains acyltransferase and SGNH-hydrolase domains [Micromonospora siamensis]